MTIQLIQPRTERLVLRQWREEDREPFANLNADPDVMKYFPKTLTRAESDASIDRLQTSIANRGWGFWAAELLDTGEFIGFVGINEPFATLPFSPCVEIGWRLAKPYWGKGYASEAARVALAVGFEQLELSEIVSFTALSNTRSTAVMERLHMARDSKTFLHPQIPEDSGLQEHCLYRLTRNRWREHLS